jgi:hypothetical protein
MLRKGFMEQLFAGSWNYSQEMPHRESLHEYLVESIAKALRKEPQEWILVAVGSYDKVGSDLKSFERAVKASADLLSPPKPTEDWE